MKSHYKKDVLNDEINVKNLPKNILEPIHKNKVLEFKKEYKILYIKQFVKNFTTLYMLFFFIYALLSMQNFKPEITVVLVPISIACIPLLCIFISLINLIRKIYNYKRYNFEKTCYAIVYDKDYSIHRTKRGSYRKYFIKAETLDGKIIKDIRVKNRIYSKVNKQDKVIVASFDNFNCCVIPLNYEKEENNFLNNIDIIIYVFKSVIVISVLTLALSKLA